MSSIFSRIHRIDPLLPSKQFWKLASKLNRRQTSILVQLRKGDALLRKHLFRIDKAEDPTCSYCGQGNESVHHFLFDCATWRHERWHMGNRLCRAAKEADSVVNTSKGVKELMKYIGCTGRFKGTFGELF